MAGARSLVEPHTLPSSGGLAEAHVGLGAMPPPKQREGMPAERDRGARALASTVVDSAGRAASAGLEAAK